MGKCCLILTKHPTKRKVLFLKRELFCLLLLNHCLRLIDPFGDEDGARARPGAQEMILAWPDAIWSIEYPQTLLNATITGIR